jgi:L-serine/L-threonine ammonia-lyase
MMVELTVGVNVPVCYGGLLQTVLRSRRTIDRSSKVVIVVCGGNDVSIEMLMAWRMNMMSGEEDVVEENATTLVPTTTPAQTKVAA